jgi:hypothetical protein
VLPIRLYKPDQPTRASTSIGFGPPSSAKDSAMASVTSESIRPVDLADL